MITGKESNRNFSITTQKKKKLAALSPDSGLKHIIHTAEHLNLWGSEFNIPTPAPPSTDSQYPT